MAVTKYPFIFMGKVLTIELFIPPGSSVVQTYAIG
jgi:hypothetical protein